MTEFKGFNVPSIGDFVSKQTKPQEIATSYCMAVECWNPIDGYIYKCGNKCIFANASDKTILEFHNNRLEKLK